MLVETVCTARKTIRVAGDDYPAELVKAKLLKLNSGHIEFVMDCMRENTTKIRNIKKYLLAVLFNAPSTMGSYYLAAMRRRQRQVVTQEEVFDFYEIDLSDEEKTGEADAAEE